METGTIYIVATPIGNLDDITIRAINTLKAVDMIACEDTRHTSKLLNHYDIKNRLTSYHDHNKEFKTQSLLEMVKGGKSLALVSDAGTPGISDPAFYLVRAAIAEGLDITSIPGPSAILAAVIISGLPTDRFIFEGFIPRRKGRRKMLRILAQNTATMVIFESPHRLMKTLKDLKEALGDRRASVGREMTKLHEEFIRGHLSEIIYHFSQKKPIGEFVIIVEGTNQG